jgi:hypothetical protein
LQKLLSALVAIISFISVLSGLTAVPIAAQDRPANGQDDPFANTASPGDKAPLVLPRGVTRENIDVKDRRLIIEGDLKGSVHAENSDITLMPGATVEGDLSIHGGSLVAAPAASGLIAATSSTTHPAAYRRAAKRGSWVGGQFCLWLLGLVGAVIVMLAAPNATSRVAETVAQRPGKSLVAGAGITAAMVTAMAVSGMIMNTRSFLSLVWMPVTILIALVSLVILVFGWLAAMRRVGDMIARRVGQTGPGTAFGRTAFGLTAFFVVNAVLGAIRPELGAVSLLIEFAIALMGVGAIVQTGFARNDPWQSRQLGSATGPDLR